METLHVGREPTGSGVIEPFTLLIDKRLVQHSPVAFFALHKSAIDQGEERMVAIDSDRQIQICDCGAAKEQSTGALRIAELLQPRFRKRVD